MCDSLLALELSSNSKEKKKKRKSLRIFAGIVISKTDKICHGRDSCGI